MTFTLIVLGAPYACAGSQTALHYARALLQAGHRIHRVFFYAEGVHNATTLAAPPQDEIDLPAEWQALIHEQSLDAVVCIAAGLRRGVLNATEAERYQRPAANLAESVDLSGLGQLVEATAQSDRVITFGS